MNEEINKVVCRIEARSREELTEEDKKEIEQIIQKKLDGSATSRDVELFVDVLNIDKIEEGSIVRAIKEPEKRKLIERLMCEISHEAAEKIVGEEMDDVYLEDKLYEIFDEATKFRCIECGEYMSEKEFEEKNECRRCGNSVVE